MEKNCILNQRKNTERHPKFNVEMIKSTEPDGNKINKWMDAAEKLQEISASLKSGINSENGEE